MLYLVKSGDRTLAQPIDVVSQPRVSVRPVDGRIQIVTQPQDGDAVPGLTIYVDDAGRKRLMSLLAGLGPSDRHFHLEPYLTVERDGDVAWADVVFHEPDE